MYNEVPKLTWHAGNASQRNRNELYGCRARVDIKIKLFHDDLLMVELNELYDKLFPGMAQFRSEGSAKCLR